MREIRGKKILDILIKFCYLAIVFLIPIYFSIFLIGNNAFDLNKIILFKILTLGLLFFTLIKIFFYQPAKICGRITLLSKQLLIPLIFLLVLFLTSLFSKIFYFSLFGLYDRQQGLISYFFYVLFFLLLILNIENFRQVKRIIITASLASFVVSFYALIQIAGFDFINWNEPVLLTGRVASTLGQPNFLASYLLLVLPLIAYLIFSSHKLLIRFIWLLGFIFGLLALFFTYSRAGWLGLILGAIITAIIFWLTTDKKLNHKHLKLAWLVLIVVVLLITAGFFKSDFLQTRLKSAVDLKGGSIAARLDFYEASCQAIKRRPWFGYGLDAQGEIFAKAYQKDWAIYTQVNVYPNRAHNLILDTLLTSGIFGLISYLALLYLFFKLIINNIKNSRQVLFSLAVLWGITGYLISLMFGFAIVATNVYFWLLLGIIILINSEFRENKVKVITLGKFWYKAVLVLCLVIIGAGIFYQINKNIKVLIADYYFRQFQQAYYSNEYFYGLKMYKEIIKLNIRDDYYKKFIAIKLAYWFDNIDSLPQKQPAEEILQEILADIKDDNTMFGLLAKAKIYTALSDYDLAKETFLELIKRSPFFPLNYRELAIVYTKEGKIAKAQEVYNKALDSLPDINDPYMNNIHRGEIQAEKYIIFKNLAELYFKQNNFDKAESYWNLAYQQQRQDILIFKKIADLYYLRGDLDKAIWYNKRGYIRNPQDYIWPFAISLLYEEQGNWLKAQEYKFKATELIK